MGSSVDYDKHFKKGRGYCGEPFKEIVDFFKRYDKKNAAVLDLGCGQGRDSLLVARKGHRVVGVDLSEIGITQMLEDANKEKLDVTGVVEDIVVHTPQEKYDIIIFDRVLHLLLNDDERLSVLEKHCQCTKKNGIVLIADTPKHQELITGFFEQRNDQWRVLKRTKNFLFASKNEGNQSTG